MPFRCQLTLRTFWPLSSKRVQENRNKGNQNAPNSVAANPMKQHIKGIGSESVWHLKNSRADIRCDIKENKKGSQAIAALPGLCWERKPGKSEASISQYVHSKSDAFIYSGEVIEAQFPCGHSRTIYWGTAMYPAQKTGTEVQKM